MKFIRQILLIGFIFLNIINLHGQTELEVVGVLDIRPGNVAVSKDGRVFSTIHPVENKNIQLIEVVGKDKYVPYPSLIYQTDRKAVAEESFDTPLGLNFDSDGLLWIVDPGKNLGKTRIWNIDISTNTVVRKINLPKDAVFKESFIQDISVDSKNGWAYLADVGSPGLIAVNLKTEKVRRLTYAQFQSEDLDMVIAGKVIYLDGKPIRSGINPISLSSDGNTIFFGAMNGIKLYSLDARLIRSDQNDEIIGKSISTAGHKPISDGFATDGKNNHYITNIAENAVSRLDAQGNLKIIIQDKKLNWPDNISLGPDGYIYVAVNQLYLSRPFNGGTDAGKPPYYIYRFKYPYYKR